MGRCWISRIYARHGASPPRRIHRQIETADVSLAVSALNRRIVLSRRPIGVPSPEHFSRDDQPVEAPGPGQFLLRNLFLSIDPAQRGWVNAVGNYSDAVPLGAVMRSLAVGVVEASQQPRVAVGEHLYGWFGWQDYCVATEQQILRRVDPRQAPLTAAVGVLGITGLTAYLALTRIGAPQPGQTVVVSTAAGAVGSVVGQIARRTGCHVVGLTSSDHKASLCTREFGYHEAINYKSGFDAAALRAKCPRGVDVFFDNTSGEIADTVLSAMNSHGRIVQCGTAAVPVWDPPPTGPRREREILVKRLRQEGFIIFDHVSEFSAVAATLAAWIEEGTLSYREDVEQGLDGAPAALQGLYQGANQGKKIIQL
jgi:NADPH-dependent curcumin reductase